VSAATQTPESAETQTEEPDSDETQTKEPDSDETEEVVSAVPKPQSTTEPLFQQPIGETCEMSHNVLECRVDHAIVLAAPGYQDRADEVVSATEHVTRAWCATSKELETAVDIITAMSGCDTSEEVAAALDSMTCVT
jgi:hypothetical protein